MQRYGTMAVGESHAVPWWLVLIEGVALVILGLFLLFSPSMTVLILIQFLGFYWVISGILGIVDIFLDRSLWGWKLLFSVISILAGLSVVRNPLWSTVLIPTLVIVFLAVAAFINGIVKFVEFVRGGGWGILTLSIVNVILAILLFARPLIAAFFLPFALGAFAFIGGIVSIIAAFRLRKTVPADARLEPS